MIHRISARRIVQAAGLVVCAAGSTLRAEQPPTVEAAVAVYNQGYYDTAIATLEKLLADRPDDGSAVAALVDCYLMVGRYADAIAATDHPSDALARGAAFQEARGRALRSVGRYDDALVALKRAVEIAPARHSARLALGELYETLGRRDDAIETYKPFDDIMHDSLPAGALDLVNVGKGFYRYSVLTRHPNLRQRTTHVLQEVFQHAAERVDPSCWQAWLASAELLESKYNADAATEDYESARRINHNLPAVFAGLGRIALEAWDFEKAEQQVTAALDINPHSPDAMHLLADVRLTERKFADAADACEEALKTNPNDLDALARLAAAKWRLGDEAAATEILKRIEAVNPSGGPFYEVMGVRLAEARQFPESERYFLKGVEAAPESSNVRTELGLMYMQWGQEDSARRWLSEAWGLDPFNRKTFNTLELLDDLDGFEQFETEHFIIRHAGGIDRAVAPYIADYMEDIYAEVCDDFEHELKEKTVIEIFPSHRKFAVRVTHQPFIHTIGACTGRVIAMDAPRPDTGFGATFNWGQVLRHEFTHTVTLAATRNRIAHWLTEGLAVYQEDTPRSWAWCRLLSKRYRQGMLYSLDDLDWGFIRPTRPDDRSAAYAESEWICEYLVETHGYSALLTLLQRLNDGVPIDDAMKEVTGDSVAAFNKAFRAWAKKQIESWHLPTDPLPNQVTLQAQLFLRPNDTKLRAQFAETLLYDGEVDKAKDEATTVLAQDENNARALEVFCRIYDARLQELPVAEAKREVLDLAAPYAERLLKQDENNLAALYLLAERADAKKDEATAERLYTRLKTEYPYDPRAYRWLAAHYLEAGNENAALPNFIDLWKLEMDDAEVAREVARIYQRRGDDAQALHWWREAVFVDPYSEDTHERIGRLLLKNNDFKTAVREFRVLADMEPDKASRWEDLALVYRRLNDESNMRAAAEKAVKIDPESKVKSLLSANAP